MSSKTKNREVAYTRAIQICQNLARPTVYELIGGQILLPRKEEGASLRPRPLVLLPVVDEPSAGAVKAVAKIETTFVAIQSTLDPEGDPQIEFTVLSPENGETTRHGKLRGWCDRAHRIFLVPDNLGNEDTSVCFQFDKGLRKAPQPWADQADCSRGLALAKTLLLATDGEGADKRHG
ncbi:MAG: hypothetical protein JKY36_00435 [Erythrobacter sp.]|nr:hypothetical protein [Erythrobacter sp.]